MYVIGTAGHVDHGKSALVKAITGIDPDRLPEEKERGLTTTLGFAWTKLASDTEVDIVDVPGHERFIKNMLAGVGGMDLTLLVIAADEGIMPQTREHLAIINLIGIEQGIVVISKSDLVDKDWLELVKEEASETVKGTTLEKAPIIACSAQNGQGLPELTSIIESELAKLSAQRKNNRPRLPIDRVFTISGFGTVVTGTLRDGPLEVGDEVELLPGGLRSRIRGLQNHSQQVGVANPGRRTAVNLSGLSVNELRRGMVMTTPGWLRTTRHLDVQLQAVGYRRRPIRHNRTVTFYSGTTEVSGRLLLLDQDELLPSETGWAQLRLQEPAAIIRGDRFVIRDPNDTLGGGKVVDTEVKRHRRFHKETLNSLIKLGRGEPADLLLIAIERLEPVKLAILYQHLELPPAETHSALTGLIAEQAVLVLGEWPLSSSSFLITHRSLSCLSTQMISEVSDYHIRHPLQVGLPKEELRTHLSLKPELFDHLLTLILSRSDLEEANNFIHLPGYTPQLTAEQASQAKVFLSAIQTAPFPSKDTLPNSDLLNYLEEKDKIVQLKGDLVLSNNDYQEMSRLVVAHLHQSDTITLAQTRDLLHTNRRCAQALLERMDDKQITRRVGDVRTLR